MILEISYCYEMDIVIVGYVMMWWGFVFDCVVVIKIIIGILNSYNGYILDVILICYFFSVYFFFVVIIFL